MRRFRAERPDVDLVLLGTAAQDPGLADYADVGPWDGSEAGAGRVAAAAIRAAVELALAGEVRGVVTAPIHKPALAAAGIPATGHTELLRDLAGTPAVGMLMAAEETRLGGPLRVLLATTHHALRAVPGLVTTELLVEQTRLLREGLRADWRIEEPMIALYALNPHASDGGLIGDEEQTEITPAIETALAEGINAVGPVPADTIFLQGVRGDYDAILAMYHDQGHIAVKMYGFEESITVNLGLPFIRTSVDHGTAFDIAWQNKADATSMVESIRAAADLATGAGIKRPVG